MYKEYSVAAHSHSLRYRPTKSPVLRLFRPPFDIAESSLCELTTTLPLKPTRAHSEVMLTRTKNGSKDDDSQVSDIVSTTL